MQIFLKLVTWFLGAILLLGIIMLMMMLAQNSPIYFSPQQPWIFWDAENAAKLDLIKLATALGVLIAAIGVSSFSYMTYKRQDNQDFDELFNTLLRQHNELLNQVDDNELDKLNADILKLYLFNRVDNPVIVDSGIHLMSILQQWKQHNFQEKNFSEHMRKFSQEAQHETDIIEALNQAYDTVLNRKSSSDERTVKAEIAFDKLQTFLQPQNRLDDTKRFEKSLKELIDGNTTVKPYLITLYRLLRFVATSEKIKKYEKNEYYGLIRAAIPPKMLFVILFNSKGWIRGQKGLTYQDLLRKAKLVEHLPISTEWLTEMFEHGYANGEQKIASDLAYRTLDIGIQNYIFTESIHSDAFGKSTYHAAWKAKR